MMAVVTGSALGMLTMSTNKQYVTLRISHENTAPEKITMRLGRNPSIVQRKGDLRGSPHSELRWTTNMWCSRFDEGDVDTQIDAAAELLINKHEVIEQLAAEGATMDMCIVAEVDEDESLPLEFRPEQLQLLGALHIRLIVEVKKSAIGNGGEF